MKKTHKIAFGVALVVIILNVVCLFGVIWLGINFLERTDETRGLQLPATEASDTQDIYLTPVTLYHYAEDAVEFVEKNREGLSETESVQLFGVKPADIGGDQLRHYVRTGSYADGRWPQFVLVKDYEVQFHYDRISHSIMVYAQPRNDRDAENDSYQMPKYVFVPSNADYTMGTWYQFGEQSDYRFQLDKPGRDVWEIYLNIQNDWEKMAA